MSSTFEARFSGVARSVSIPVDNVSAIYAQENGHGMAFDVPKALYRPPLRAWLPGRVFVVFRLFYSNVGIL